MAIGHLRHLLTLENPGVAVPTSEGYTQAWTALTPAKVSAEIKPATAHDLERRVASTIQSNASHIVTMRYLPGVTTQTRLTKGPRNSDGTLPAGSREFSVTGVQNTDERNIELILACQEVVA